MIASIIDDSRSGSGMSDVTFRTAQQIELVGFLVIHYITSTSYRVMFMQLTTTSKKSRNTVFCIAVLGVPILTTMTEERF